MTNRSSDKLWAQVRAALDASIAIDATWQLARDCGAPTEEQIRLQVGAQTRARAVNQALQDYQEAEFFLHYAAYKAALQPEPPAAEQGPSP